MSGQQVTPPNVAMTLPSRPSLGVAGRKTKVGTNHYEFSKKPSGPFHHYDCKIIDKEPRKDGKPAKPIPPAKNTLIMQQYAETVLKHKVRFAYDAKSNLYTYAMLPDDKLSAEVTLIMPGSRSSDYKVVLHYVAIIPSEPFYKYLAGNRPASETEANNVTSYIRVIDIMLHQWPAQRFVPGGKNFFCPDDATPMSSGLMMLKGAFQSARMAGVGMNGKPTNKLLVNVDTAAAAFRQPLNLVEAMGRFFNMKPDNFLRFPGPGKEDTDAFKKEYRGVEIECTHIEHRPRYKIDRFTYVTADKVKFTDDQTKKETTVVAYFKKQYNLQLKFGACLPCVVIKKKKDIYLPVEVCVIVKNQRYNNKLNPNVQAEFIQYACVQPNERVKKIQELTRRIEFDNNPDLKAFDMGVNTKQMLILDARILREPALAYNSTSRQSKLTPKAGWGSWNLDGQKVITGAKLSSWAVVAFGSENEMPTSVIDAFVKQLINVCQIQGMDIVNKNPKIVRGNRYGDPSSTLDKAYATGSDSTNSKLMAPQMIMCILNDQAKSAKLYDPCKKWGDCKKGVITQCVIYKNVAKNAQRPQIQYCANLFLKINAKLGGKNVILDQSSMAPWNMSKDTLCMIIGVDVTHAPPGSVAPSIATMVGTMDQTFVQYADEMRAQPTRKEIVLDFGGMLKGLLNRFSQKSNNKRPQRILVYRDGVSEGMYEIVKKYEIDAIKKACSEISKDYNPQVTFVAVQKRHHTRFFPQGQPNDADRSGNCVPGTIVETVVTHPYEYDFFLQSHSGIQGTSRPTHYQVLYDDYKFKPDELQLLTYNLCYTYARCTRSVSVVPPIFYADQCGYRAKAHLKDPAMWSGDGSRRTTESGENNQDVALQLETLSADIKGKMWWI